jgi:DNA-binding CsgD family transcriptional regulator
LIPRADAATMRLPTVPPMARQREGNRANHMRAGRRPARQPTNAVTPPFVVIESENPAAEGHLRRAIERARADGWQPVAGWLPPRGRAACHGVLATDADAVLALRAAVSGAGILAITRIPRETTDRLIDDLRRIGAVEHVTADVAPLLAPDEDQRRLLCLLADGHTLGEAAAALGLARRTADRRLDAARRALGAERTADALARARQLGWFDPIGTPD